jgi:hypothetical protein
MVLLFIIILVISTFFYFQIQPLSLFTKCTITLKTSIQPTITAPQIIIGGWSNKMSALKSRKAKRGHIADTPGILSKDEFREFWIDINKNAIKIGRKKEVKL